MVNTSEPAFVPATSTDIILLEAAEALPSVPAQLASLPELQSRGQPVVEKHLGRANILQLPTEIQYGVPLRTYWTHGGINE